MSKGTKETKGLNITVPTTLRKEELNTFVANPCMFAYKKEYQRAIRVEGLHLDEGTGAFILEADVSGHKEFTYSDLK